MKLDMTKLVPAQGQNNDSAAALSNATHLTNQMTAGKLDMTKISPSDGTSQSDAIPPENKSAYEKVGGFFGDIGAGIDKGIASTAVGLHELGTKILQPVEKAADWISTKITGKEPQPSDLLQPEDYDKAREFLKPTDTAQKVGFGAEQIGEFFIPESKIAETEKILGTTSAAKIGEKLTPIVGEKTASFLSKMGQLGVKMAIRGAEGGGIIAAQTGGDEKSTKSAALISSLLPPAAEIAKPVAKVVGEAGKRFAGAITGRGTAVINSILDNPKAALEGLTGQSIESLSKNFGKVKGAVSDLSLKAKQEYSRVLNNIQEVFENEGQSFDKNEETSKIGKTLNERFGIEANSEDPSKLDFTKTRFIPKEESVIQRAYQMITNSEIGSFGPKQMDQLAAKLEKLKSNSPSAIDVNDAIHTMINSLRGSITDKAESVGYMEGADMTKKYAQAMDKIDLYNKMFKATTTPFTTAVEQTRGEKALSLLFSGNKESEREALSSMGIPDVVSREAGRTLATATERPGGNIGEKLWNSLIAPLVSPKQIGIIAAKLGMASDKMPEFIDSMQKISPAVRGLILEGLSKKNDNQ